MRVRITFSKTGWMIYSSHLDLMRAWERALRRAGVSLAYSGGFNPRPKLQLARALPLGHVGEKEILDVWFEEPVTLDSLETRLMAVLPDGLDVTEVHQVDEKAPPMQTRVVATVYRVQIETEARTDKVRDMIEETLSRDTLIHERRGKRYDLRPLVENLELLEGESASGWLSLRMRLSARPGGTGRPEAVLDVLDLGGLFARYCRERLIVAGEAETR